MDSMMAALPDYRAPMESYGLSQAPQRFPLTATSPLIIQQQQQRQNLPHFGGPGSLGSAPYNVAFQSHFGSTHPQAQAIPLTSPQFFSPQHSGQPNRSAMTGQIQTQFGGAPFYSGQQQLHQPYGVYPSSYGQVNPSQPNLAGLFAKKATLNCKWKPATNGSKQDRKECRRVLWTCLLLGFSTRVAIHRAHLRDMVMGQHHLLSVQEMFPVSFPLTCKTVLDYFS